jgi:hypothetical protein
LVAPRSELGRDEARLPFGPAGETDRYRALHPTELSRHRGLALLPLPSSASPRLRGEILAADNRHQFGPSKIRSPWRTLLETRSNEGYLCPLRALPLFLCCFSASPHLRGEILAADNRHQFGPSKIRGPGRTLTGNPEQPRLPLPPPRSPSLLFLPLRLCASAVKFLRRTTDTNLVLRKSALRENLTACPSFQAAFAAR